MRNSKPFRWMTVSVLPLGIMLSGCGSDTSVDNTAELTAFRTQVDDFCTSIAAIDTNINAIDTKTEGYETTLLSELDSLELSFKNFAAIDFPSDYDYLEGLADEASNYMDTAVESYHDIFENEYSADLMDSKYIYASENYSRAYKRIQVIITFLNGEISEDVTVTTQ